MPYFARIWQLNYIKRGTGTVYGELTDVYVQSSVTERTTAAQCELQYVKK